MPPLNTCSLVLWTKVSDDEKAPRLVHLAFTYRVLPLPDHNPLDFLRARFVP